MQMRDKTLYLQQMIEKDKRQRGVLVISSGKFNPKIANYITSWDFSYLTEAS
jgi:hypothetical protein